eukprot:CAMPEP_0175096858 /NCGR_PEP_ID=MMETSP0086_2-20121207/4964_1 /TAXON_ID=136419 /ORGANISM="Unknown Unknown, Strain D1" /LENGTH=271 /DNA_ID=CAMNT_0016370303 /DNA_START=93 /DNA_END=908 /DNA_ORIENTATION=+
MHHDGACVTIQEASCNSKNTDCLIAGGAESSAKACECEIAQAKCLSGISCLRQSFLDGCVEKCGAKCKDGVKISKLNKASAADAAAASVALHVSTPFQSSESQNRHLDRAAEQEAEKLVFKAGKPVQKKAAATSSRTVFLEDQTEVTLDTGLVESDKSSQEEADLDAFADTDAPESAEETSPPESYAQAGTRTLSREQQQEQFLRLVVAPCTYRNLFCLDPVLVKLTVGMVIGISALLLIFTVMKGSGKPLFMSPTEYPVTEQFPGREMRF